MTFKNAFLLSLFVLVFTACNDNDFTPFDHVAQAKIDDEALVDYMQTHYFDEESGQIKEVSDGETPFYDQVVTEEINYLDVTYNLYHIITKEGIGYQPTQADNVLPTYRGELLDGTVFDERVSVTIGNPWFNLGGVIPGWRYGLVHFRGGENISQPNAPLEFTNFGEGFLFIPSGLAYRELASAGGIPPSSPLVFKIALQYASDTITIEPSVQQ